LKWLAGKSVAISQETTLEAVIEMTERDNFERRDQD
jgi:hypothetical protein